MTRAIHDKEFANVLALSGPDRYSYMCAKFGGWREVWSLRSDEGWVLASDDSGREGVPVWPHPKFAEACATGSWAGTNPASIPLLSWINKWLPGMAKDNRYLAAFPLPGPASQSVQVDPLKHREHLLEELKKYGFDGESAEDVEAFFSED